jgi:acyl-CoA synthetase (AMP-forming)/AMP-acid ligase II
MMGGPAFYAIDADLESTALIQDGESISYRTLAAEVEAFRAQLGPERSLVFLSVRNDIASVARYLACLQGNHPVHLFSDDSPERLETLTKLYNPHYIIRSEDDTVAPRHRQPLDIHHDVSVLLSTSGSTGTAKLVKLSKRNLQANAEAIAAYLELTKQDRALLNLKFSYSYGLSVLHTHLLRGASLVLTEASVTEPEFWHTLRTQEVTSFAGVPYSFELLERDRRIKDLKSLRYITQAGGKLSPQLVTRFAELGAQQGWKFFVMYGQTEAAPRISYLPPDMAITYPNCIGLPVQGGKLWLRAANGEEITTRDTAGELIYEGPNIMMGYAESLVDLGIDEKLGELPTGDIACRNEAGLFFIVGRTKRFVKPFGIRVNLDDVQQRAAEVGSSVAVTGDDSHIMFITDNTADAAALKPAIAEFAADLNLPVSVMRLESSRPCRGSATARSTTPACARNCWRRRKPPHPYKTG